MKNFSLLLCLALSVLHLIGMPEYLALSQGTENYTRITYMLIHGNWMHLFVNIYALLTLVFLCDIKAWHFLSGLAIAISVPNIGDLSLVGMSTLIYAVTGIIVMNSSRWWWFAILNLLIIGAGIFMPGIAFFAHLYCFLLGMLVGLLTSKRYGREIN